MKKYYTIIAILLLISTRSVQAQENRTYLSGEDAATAVNWNFKINEGRNSGFWTTIPVPSNWETEGFGYYLYGMDKMEERGSGIANYRHEFHFQKKLDKRYFIVFQGSMTDTKVVLNGKEIGYHQGGHTEFKFEITNALKNEKNNLEVEVNNSSTNKSIIAAERFADYWMFSGIYRPVFIEEVATKFIERVAIDAKMNGDFTMQVFTNGANESQNISVQLYDANHKKIGRPFSANISDEFTVLKSHFKDVAIWSHEFPNLYSVEVTLKNKKEVLHTYKQKFGFRTFEVRDHDGFYLNNKRILLKRQACIVLDQKRPELSPKKIWKIIWKT